MALNIFPRKDNQPTPPQLNEPEQPPAIEAAAEDDNPGASSSSRRSTRTRRGTSRSRTETRDKAEAAPSDSNETAEAASATEEPKSTRSRGTRSRARKTEEQEQSDQPDESQQSSRRRSTRSTAKEAAPAADLGALVKAVEQQGKQIEALSRALADGRGDGAAQSYAPPARVGVFVDVANIELGADRARVRFEWGKVLRFLSRERQLIRALAYAPVHDDPGVSRETQRFVEPFLDKGYKIITKPLKRFSDGTIKANVDIELALDVVNMLDRLDIVCLVSGDGDFEPLVKAAQDRGVRVEVVALGTSCSNHLRDTADAFVDLAAHAKELRR